MQSKTIHIIGAGVAGLAVAIRLACKGHQVHIFEANDYPGGKLTAIQQDGFRFDAGPSLFTLPQLMVELLQLCHANNIETFAYTRLPITCRYFYEDSTVINGYADPKKFALEVYRKTGEHPRQVYQHLQKSQQIFQITAPVFLEKSLHKIRTYLSPTTLFSFLQLPRINAFQTMHQANAQQFKHPKVIQLFNRFATYNGSNPYKAPATLNVIPHLEHHKGAYFPIGGMHAITQTLYQLAQQQGVQFHLNTKVDRIIVKNKKAVGIIANKHSYDSDVVISNADVFATYRHLMPDQKAPEKTLQQPKSSSALVFYWGIGKVFPQLDLHNIFFSEDYQAEFEHIFQHKTIYDDPSIYLNITSKYQASDAPVGCENWFVMINVPNNSGQHWATLIPQSRQYILTKLSRMLQIDIASLIQTEHILDPRTIEQKTSSHLGALYGNSSNNRWAAFLRHPNFSNAIKNLYFCGGSVHPGGGIPLCLQSAKIVANMI